jgi:hypothetical protein
MQSMLELATTAGMFKFEYFWMLKHFLSDPDRLFRIARALNSGRWLLDKTCRDTFPLTDSPILARPGSVMVALSPRLLLEIDKSDTSRDDSWTTINHVSPEKLAEFRRRPIGNTFREIIFGEQELLEQWRLAPEFSTRRSLHADTTTYNKKVADYLGGEVWQFDAHGNTLAW